MPTNTSSLPDISAVQVLDVQLRQQLMQARELRLAQQLAQAEQLLRSIINSTKQHTQALQAGQVVNIGWKELQAHCTFELAAIASAVNKPEQTLALLQHAVHLQPENPQFCLLLGVQYGQADQDEEAEHWFKQSLQAQPNWEAYYNLGVIYLHQVRLEEAKQAYQSALKLAPAEQGTRILLSLAKALHKLGELSTAINYYQQVLSTPNIDAELYHETQLSLGLALLLKGDYQRAWPLYEARWRIADRSIETPDGVQCPRWQGENLQGKRLLVLDEQGYGDTLQFIRFLPQLNAQACFLRCADPLIPLLQNSLGISTIYSYQAELPECDYYVHLTSLPAILNIGLADLPLATKYIQAPERIWQVPPTGLKVGLVWAGNPGHKNDKNRSCPLEAFSQLWQIDSIHWISLQKGSGQAQLQNTTRTPLIDAGSQLQNFADTASLLQHLDLIISVDTSVVHLAGAMGKACWVLLPFLPDWRWLEQGDTTPWYPSLRLFRQTSAGDWDTPISQIQQALQNLVNKQ